MAVISDAERPFVQAVAMLNYTNPFAPERLALEQQALGDEFVPEPDTFWSLTPEQSTQRRPNLIRLLEYARQTADQIRQRLLQKLPADDSERQLYDDLSLYVLFYELLESWGQRLPPGTSRNEVDRQAWDRFSTEFDRRIKLPGLRLPSAAERTSLFELFHQIYRAFFTIFECVIGRSRPAAALRARIWQSIFTHNLHRYRRSLRSSLAHVTTLITGPSGSGKELVAQAIGLSRCIPFLERERRFAAQPDETYAAINISAFARNLVESELFGHAKGAFTDASAARAGWLEACGEHGAVLLDEIGELDPTTQVKLLRVLQNRQFQRIGETKVRDFHGKIIAATNRDLRREIEAGRFREDLYYRLCADVIETPSLAAQTRDNPDMLHDLVTQIVERIAPSEKETLTAEVLDGIARCLPADYHWPGNIRELEQCVRNIMICGSYSPSNPLHPVAETAPLPREILRLAQRMQSLDATADEVLQHYCRWAHRQTGSFEQAARRLLLDRRTVRAKADEAKDE
ncbi:MAG: Transcriptional regulatory protein ZraR [Planctomycetota bacterium]|jgi:transcriptional regulator with AAA-type ATPase domain